jgi:hypothetical protein
MRGDGSTLIRIPRKLLVQVQMNKDWRLPFRMLLCIREFIGNKFYVNDPIHQRILIDVCGFSDYQVKKYFKVLVEDGFMRKNNKGDFNTFKMTKICPPETREDGKHKRTTHRQIAIATILDNDRFKKFLRGHPILAVADTSTRSKRGKRKAACYAAKTVQGGGNCDYLCVHSGRTISRHEIANLNVAQGVSLSNLQDWYGMSKSTMARWRTDGQEAGYEKWDAYQPINKAFENMPLWKLQQYIVKYGLAGDIDPNLLKTVIVNGKKKVMMQVPSQIAIRENPFYYA